MRPRLRMNILGGDEKHTYAPITGDEGNRDSRFRRYPIGVARLIAHVVDEGGLAARPRFAHRSTVYRRDHSFHACAGAARGDAGEREIVLGDYADGFAGRGDD